MKWWDMVHGCMVRTECTMVAAVSDGTSHVTTKQCCKYTTLVDIQNALWKATVIHLKSHNTTAQQVYLKAENRHHINATNNNKISMINSKCMDICVTQWGWAPPTVAMRALRGYTADWPHSLTTLATCTESTSAPPTLNRTIELSLPWPWETCFFLNIKVICKF